MQDRKALSAAVTAILSDVRLVPARPFRRLLRSMYGLSQFGERPHHDQLAVVSPKEIHRHLDLSELGLTEPPNSTEALVLIPEPKGDLTEDDAKREVRMALFHAECDRLLDTVRVADPDWPNRMKQSLGPTFWAETREVLMERNRIGSEATIDEVAREFVALAAELLEFDPEKVDVCFPGRPLDRTLPSLFPVGFDPSAIRLRTEWPGLSDRIPNSHPEPTAPLSVRPGPRHDMRSVAADASRVKNHVRACVAAVRAGDGTVETHFSGLCDRIRNALRLSASEARDWQDALGPLLIPAAKDGWPVERRLLYELQKACLDVEKDTYAVSLGGWIGSLGQKPLKRRLSYTRNLTIIRRLRTATRFDERSSIGRVDRLCLDRLLHHAAERIEAEARAELRPIVLGTFDDVGLTPRSRVEEISRNKCVEELLDSAVARGFLRIGDLRDALARSRVKLNDLSGPLELLRGDALLQSNRLLAERLDGVYRRGEVYMRWLQRGCSLFFGTKPGRAFTRFVGLPFGAAYVILEGVHHMVEAGTGLANWLSGWSATVHAVGALGGGPSSVLVTNPTLEHHGFHWLLFGLTGMVLFLLMHWPAFRRRTLRSAEYVFVRIPRRIIHSPAIRRIFHNPITRFVRLYLLLPGLVGSAAFLVSLGFCESATAGLIGGSVAVLTAVFIRTAFGRSVEDQFNETVDRVWRIVSVNFVMGMISWILHQFRKLLDWIERIIYAVDEMLRFREGESAAAFAFKIVFGMFWGVFTYLFRFAWNLLVEPQINPIKHFPVVTVSHKMLLPLIPSLAKQFGTSDKLMGAIVSGIPGIFGFLVWELKENWKLYRANASPDLRPVSVGSHGESMRGLLRPGFHSGVVPKTFGKWRKAEFAGHHRRAEKLHHHLHHAAEFLHSLVRRETAAILSRSRRWGGLPVEACEPQLSPNRVRFPLVIGPHESPLVVSIEHCGGWLIGSIEAVGPLGSLTADQQGAIRDAVAGLYKLCGVHAVREQTAEVLGAAARDFDATSEGWEIPDGFGRSTSATYDDGVMTAEHDRLLPADRLVLSDRPISWVDWTDRWEQEKAERSPVADWVFLPPCSPKATAD